MFVETEVTLSQSEPGSVNACCLGVSLGGPGPIRLRWHLAGVAQAPTASPTQDADTWGLEPSTHGVGALRSAEAAGRVRQQQRPGPQATALP